MTSQRQRPSAPSICVADDDAAFLAFLTDSMRERFGG
jgi:hypothetical protein